MFSNNKDYNYTHTETINFDPRDQGYLLYIISHCTDKVIDLLNTKYDDIIANNKFLLEFYSLFCNEDNYNIKPLKYYSTITNMLIKKCDNDYDIKRIINYILKL